MRILPVLLLAAVAVGQEPETLTLIRRPERAEDLVRRVARRLHEDVRIDPELADRIVLVDLVRVPKDKAIARVAELVGGDVGAAKEGVVTIRPPWKTALLEKLSTEIVDSGGTRAIGPQWLRSVAGISWMLDPESGDPPTASFDPKGMSCDEILNRIVNHNQLTWDLRWGVVYVGKTERLAQLRQAIDLGSPAGQKASLPFRKTPLRGVAGYLSAAYGARVVLANGDTRPDGTVTVQAEGITLDQALALVTLPYGLDVRRKGGAIALEKPRRVSFDVKVRKIEEVLNVVFKNARVELDPAYANANFTAKCTGFSERQALAFVAETLGGSLCRRASDAWAIVPAWKRTVLMKLEREGAVTLQTIAPAPLRQLLQKVSLESGVTIVWDPQLDDAPDVELHVNAVSARATLDLLTAPNGLAWDLRYGVVFVSTPDRLKRLPKANPFRGKGLTTREIDVPFQETAIPVALQYLQAASGVRVEAAPGQRKAIDVDDVTLVAAYVEFPDALALTLLPFDLAADIRDGAVFVRPRK